MARSGAAKDLSELHALITRLIAMRDRSHFGMVRVRYTNALDQLRLAGDRLQVDVDQAKAAKTG